MRHRLEWLAVVLRLALVVAVVLACIGAPPYAPAFAQDASAVETSLALDRPTRRLIQQGLSNEGFDPGAPDGLFGPRTRDAIRRWQEAQGLPATSYLDHDQVERLRAASAPTPAAESAAPPTPAADCEAWNTEEFFKTVTAEDVAACLAAGADVAARDAARQTPLHWAAWSSKEPAVIEALLAGRRRPRGTQRRRRDAVAACSLEQRESGHRGGTALRWRRLDGAQRGRLDRRSSRGPAQQQLCRGSTARCCRRPTSGHSRDFAAREARCSPAAGRWPTPAGHPGRQLPPARGAGRSRPGP